MSLRDGGAKMSKSDPSEMSRINLSDDADTIMKKVKKAKSDADALPSEKAGWEGRAEALNLVTIYAAMTGKSVDEVLGEFGGEGFGKFKPALGEVLVETLSPISARFRELKEDRESLDAILARGAAKARELGSSTLSATYEALGLVRN
jgi:tryptophanyl-tRNA synthetase